MTLVIRVGLILIVIFFFASCNSADEAIFIVPNNFTGYILVIYDQKETGDIIEYETGKRLYRVPSSGVVKTQFSSNDGLAKVPDFYYEKMSIENKISFELDFDKIAIDSVVAHGGAVGSANSDLAGKERVYFAQYYVGTKDQISNFSKELDRLDILRFSE